MISEASTDVRGFVQMSPGETDLRRETRVQPPCNAPPNDVIHENGSVGAAMISMPKVLPLNTTVLQARREFNDDHVHMLLLVHDSTLIGTLVRSDLPPRADRSTWVAPYCVLEGRVVSPREPLTSARRRMLEAGLRRMAVVNANNKLAGLLCLKRNRTGFCGDADVADRAAERKARDDQQ